MLQIFASTSQLAKTCDQASHQKIAVKNQGDLSKMEFADEGIKKRKAFRVTVKALKTSRPKED